MALRSESVQHPALHEIILGITRHTGIVNVYVDCQDARGWLWCGMSLQARNFACVCGCKREITSRFRRWWQNFTRRQELDHAPHHYRPNIFLILTSQPTALFTLLTSLEISTRSKEACLVQVSRNLIMKMIGEFNIRFRRVLS